MIEFVTIMLVVAYMEFRIGYRLMLIDRRLEHIHNILALQARENVPEHPKEGSYPTNWHAEHSFKAHPVKLDEEALRKRALERDAPFDSYIVKEEP